MGGLIDLNTTEDDETPSSGSLSLSSSSASGLSAPGSGPGPGSSVCLELWHACAGPLISLPKRGNVVVYFPQGHLEQVFDFPGVVAAYDLPPHVFCRVVDVKLHAEGATDEVYAQVSLIPESEQFEQKFRGKTDAAGEEDDPEANIKSTTPHMFCKTLTASDTSTHGGFSVPRRAAEDCFPPLDYNQQRPSQELVAKDLHGSEWRFRHIYRGQPRRHLLTSGWSAFVNKKKLVSGDAVLFLRGEDGELRLGIRRVAQIKNGSTFPSLRCQQLNHNTFADVVRAISMKGVFSIYYNPRASSSEFVIPVHKFLKSLDHSFSIGMRFKMRFEADDAAERRHSGVVTGISDMDPLRWPGSKWRCLLVRWDDINSNRHSRVSPWEIEPSGSVSSSDGLFTPGSKRNRVGKSEFMSPDGIGVPNFEESLQSQKVLQVQENSGFNTLYDVSDRNMHRSEIRRCIPGSIGSSFAAVGNVGRDPLVSPDISFKSVGFGESFRFHKVLQGQEIFATPRCRKGSAADETPENDGLGLADAGKLLGTRSGWSSMIQGYKPHSNIRQYVPSTQASSPPSVLMFQQASNPIPNFNPINNFSRLEKEQGVNTRSSVCAPETYGGKLFPSSTVEHDFRGRDLGRLDPFSHSIDSVQLGDSLPLAGQPAFRTSQELDSSCKSSCRLFGFPLTEGRHDARKEENMVQATLSLAPGAFVPCVGEQFLPNSSSMTNTVGSNCTKVSNLYAVRDMVFDIAL
ncbi:hypothetical protein HRI_000955300 [Hibiscus trionum]|uniref:Auxin response factor n=1 Tax=Hibiscus trionum TaxID=183268 RepID=A0A9W7LRN8_HIBTR|nr:hypothetical protein HRI_000955300 [Hibiscus trionum]